MTIQTRQLCASWERSWKIVIAILVVISSLQFLTFKIDPLEQRDIRGVGINCNGTATAVTMASTSTALVPGELPGYTGWARPEKTLARYFFASSLSTQELRVGEEFFVRVQCQGHEDCSKGNALFFLRAYGPSVIPGIATSEGNGAYRMHFVPMDSGSYTVEVVLTFSSHPPFDIFPLPGDEDEPAYEGYLLPGFPLQIFVRDPSNIDNSEDATGSPSGKTLCSTDDLTESSSSSAVYKARWKVKSKSNQPGYTSPSIDTPTVTQSGYTHLRNSLGIEMNYEYTSDCILLPRSAFAKREENNHAFARCGVLRKSLQVIFIGDSVMRVQKDMFEGMVGHLKHIKTSYANLYGGYRRAKKLETDFEILLSDIQRRAPNDAKVVIFNTGLHDIHRLCGQEWSTDRYEYLDKAKLDSGKFFCVDEYKLLLNEFATIIEDYDANLRIFQSSTAAWPKYGNFGIEWPFGSQTLPLVSDMVSYFNDIAFEVLGAYGDSIQITDGYWITYSRPDNREIGTIGSKLSHPGLEVQSAMVRTLAMLILENVCS